MLFCKSVKSFLLLIKPPYENLYYIKLQSGFYKQININNE